MLPLRTAIGLAQPGLAEYLGVSRRAVGEWEAGSSYPKAEHLKQFLTLAVEQQALPTGREEEEIRAFWKAARQKALLDEPWLFALLSQPPAPLALVAPLLVEETRGPDHVLAPAAGGPPLDLGGALVAAPLLLGVRGLGTLVQVRVPERRPVARARVVG